VKIVWDGRVLCGSEIRGMGNYATNLFHALRTARPELEILPFTDIQGSSATTNGHVPAHVVGPTRGYRWHVWEQLVLPMHAYRVKADLLHSPANTCPSWSPMPRVVTVHDVIPYLPDVSGEPLHGRYWRRTVPDAVRRAHAILTDSEASRQDIARTFGVAPSRITVAPLAVGADVVVPEDRGASVTRGLGIRQPFVLALAATAPRKNTLGVLRVFKHLASQNDDVALVLTGVGSKFRSHLEAALLELEIPAVRVHLLDFVDSRVRNALYAQASVFAFLSLYEGFGLPILEAMRCGAPVLCSNRSSCPEVAGDAAVVVDPDDEAAAVSALSDMLSWGAQERERWQARGHAREREFTWARCAQTTLEVYDRVMQ